MKSNQEVNLSANKWLYMYMTLCPNTYCYNHLHEHRSKHHKIINTINGVDPITA